MVAAAAVVVLVAFLEMVAVVEVDLALEDILIDFDSLDQPLEVYSHLELASEASQAETFVEIAVVVVAFALEAFQEIVVVVEASYLRNLMLVEIDFD